MSTDETVLSNHHFEEFIKNDWQCKLNIVNRGGWILQRIANEVAEACKSDFDVEVTKNIGPSIYDITYYVNYALCRDENPQGGILVGYFTHQEDDQELQQRWLDAVEILDNAVYIADRYKPNLPGRKIYPTSHKVEMNEKLTIGVCGRTYPSGRKGEDRIIEIDKKMDNIKWHFLGSGWERLPLENEVEISIWQSEQQADDWYRSLDVFISPSHIEGGSIPHLEAIKCGVPRLISWDVGNIEEWGYAYDIVIDTLDCVTILKEDQAKHDKDFKLASSGWKDFGKAHLKYFNKLINDKNKE
jgi:glycosyltransferase involved in cell wall biosynthesis